MARKVVQKTSFLGGEAGHLLEGRSDLAQHQLGLSPGQNFIHLKPGATTRRPGTRFVTGTASNKPARIIPFVISYDSAADIYAVSISLASATTLDFRVIRVSDNSSYTPTGSPLTVSSDINLDEIQFGQSAEFLFIVHKSFAPQILFRATSSPTFTLTPYINYATTSRALGYSLPYRDPNTSAITLTIDNAAVGTGRTITASAAFFNAGHVGTYFSVDADADGDYEGAALITGFTSSTEVIAQVVEAWADTTAGTVWREGSWSTYRGFPRTVTLYSQRLVFGGNTSEPDTFWMSEVADYFQMSTDPTVTAISRPLKFTLASPRLNQIRWMVGGKKLTIGTSSSEWVGTVSNDGTNLFVQFDEETTHGSAPAQSYKSAYAVPFIQRSGKTIREMAFNFDNDAYEATDLNLFGSHVGDAYGRFVSSTGVRLVQLAYQESPFNVLWVIDSFGRLYGLTRDKQQQIASWHSHVIGGKMTELVLSGLDGADYPAFVTSICVIPDTNGRMDRLWMVVRRTINATDTYHIEYMDDIKTNPFLTAGTTGNLKAHLDCATMSTGAGSVTWTGFTRFASDTAYVVAENSAGGICYSGELSVSAAGEITIPVDAVPFPPVKVVVGKLASAILRILPIEGGDGLPLNMHSEKGADSVAIRMHETWGLKIGQNRIPRITGNEENEDFEEIPFDHTTVPLQTTFTGTKIVGLPTNEDIDQSFALAAEGPWPCTILSLSTRVTANEV
jgi:hypothetical protein